MFLRVATKHNLGPYRNEQGSLPWDPDGTYGSSRPHPHHPRPRDDELMGKRWDTLYQAGYSDMYVFGFIDPSQFRDWFFTEQARINLDRIGYRLYVFESHGDLIIGRTQAACIITWPHFSYSLSLLEV